MQLRRVEAPHPIVHEVIPLVAVEAPPIASGPLVSPNPNRALAVVHGWSSAATVVLLVSLLRLTEDVTLAADRAGDRSLQGA